MSRSSPEPGRAPAIGLAAAAKVAFGWLQQRFELNRAGAAGHLASMEGLRGFAVALVFLVHYATLVQPWVVPGSRAAEVLSTVHRIGNAGVDLFFVLSGFLIYGALIRSPIRFGAYFRRRLKRIYPPFLCVLGLYLLLSILLPSQSKMPGDLTAASIYVLENLLLLPGVFPIEPIITVAWSLSYEFLYYLAMPALILVFGLQQRSPAWRSAFFCGLVVAALAVATPGTPLRLVMFIAGVLLHEVLAAWPRAAPHGGVAILATVGALAVVAMPSAPAAVPVKLIVLFAGFFILCFACFARPGALLSRLFCTTWLRWLGNMSYSFYLLHGLALKALFLVLARGVAAPQAPLWPALLLLPAFLSTLVPSALLFLVVERPLSLRVGRSAEAGSRSPRIAEAA